MRSLFLPEFDLLVANPSRLLEINEENESLLNLNEITFLIVDEYIQFRKMQAMDLVKKCVDLLPVAFLPERIIKSLR